MRPLHRRTLAIACLCISGLVLRSQAQATDADSVAVLIGRYRESPADAVQQVGIQRLDPRALSSAIKRSTRSTPQLRSAFVLELAFGALRTYTAPRPLLNDSLDDLSQPPTRPRPRPTDFADVFEVSSDLAASARTNASFTAAWREAALSMLEGAAEVPPQAAGNLGAPSKLLLSFLDRVADTLEPGRLHLARSVVHERAVAAVLDYDLPTFQGFHLPSAAANGALIHGNLERERSAALAELEKARRYDSSRALADVHMAQLFVERGEKGDLELALDRVREAVTLSAGRPTQYLARLLEGRVQSSLGHSEAATKALEAAEALIPGADAASLSLAAHYYLDGRRSRADQLVRRVLTAGTLADPWAYFLMPEYQAWESRIQTLREAVR